jgi:hypothetical protein
VSTKKLLFSLPYPGHLRYFDSVIEELVRRGWSVELWFDTPDKQPEGIESVQSLAGVTVGGTLPKRRDRFHHAAKSSRVVVDFVHYLDPRYAQADYLRDRVGKKLRGRWQVLRRLPQLPAWLVRRLIAFGLVVERALPTAPELDRLLAERRPDLVMAAPVLMPGSRGGDLLKSAHSAGLPTVGAISSWDNFTTKGIFRVLPDRILVWNEAQVDEGVEQHLLPRDRIHVTGAQPFDRWFERVPTRDREAFAARVGLDAASPYILFVGSTASISDPDAEIRFVLEWLRRMRASDGVLADVGVMVRPHPYNSTHWPGVDLSAYRAVLWPPAGANPVNDDDRADYFDSIAHSAAIVGINTTAMIESAIQRKPVFSVALPEFLATQTGTVHFQYLLPENGGFVRVATGLDEHLRQLEQALLDPGAARAEVEAFLRRFVRPLGLDRPATPVAADLIESTTRLPARRDNPVARLVAAAALRTVFYGPARGRAVRARLRRLAGAAMRA